MNKTPMIITPVQGDGGGGKKERNYNKTHLNVKPKASQGEINWAAGEMKRWRANVRMRRAVKKPVNQLRIVLWFIYSDRFLRPSLMAILWSKV